MHVRTLVTAAGAVTALASAGNALGQVTSEPHCGTFVVYAEVSAWHVLDHGEEGETPGDQVTLNTNMLDADGNVVGVSHTVVTYLPEMEDGSQLIHGSSYHTYPNGSIALVTVTPATITHDEAELIDHLHERPVVGGTGDFAHATGTATAVTLEDGTRQNTYNLMCPN